MILYDGENVTLSANTRLPSFLADRQSGTCRAHCAGSRVESIEFVTHRSNFRQRTIYMGSPGGSQSLAHLAKLIET